MRGTFELVVGGIVEHPEAVLVEGLVISLLHLFVRGERQTHLVDPQRGPPLLARAEAFGQNRERRRLIRGRLAMGIGQVGRGTAIAGEGLLLPVFLRVDGEIFARELEPGLGILLIEERGRGVGAGRRPVILRLCRLVALGKPALRILALGGPRRLQRVFEALRLAHDELVDRGLGLPGMKRRRIARR